MKRELNTWKGSMTGKTEKLEHSHWSIRHMETEKRRGGGTRWNAVDEGVMKVLPSERLNMKGGRGWTKAAEREGERPINGAAASLLSPLLLSWGLQLIAPELHSLCEKNALIGNKKQVWIKSCIQKRLLESWISLLWSCKGNNMHILQSFCINRWVSDFFLVLSHQSGAKIEFAEVLKKSIFVKWFGKPMWVFVKTETIMEPFCNQLHRWASRNLVP